MEYLPIISLVLAVVVFGGLKDIIKKYPVVFYLAFVILEVFLLLQGKALLKTENQIIRFFVLIMSRGALATSLFIIVMYVGCFSGNNPIRKIFMPIRGELSIIASIMVFAHNISYGIYYFPKFFMHPSELKVQQLIATIITLVMLVMLIPLFVTSFNFIRKKMNAEKWKKLQKLAYPYFILIYAHVMVLYIGGIIGRGAKPKYIIGIIYYSAVYILYIILRIRKNSRKNKQLD